MRTQIWTMGDYMHELAVTQGILDIAVKEAEKAGGRTVTDINIKLGVFSGMVPDCIQEYYDLLSEDTPAHGAKLHFEKIPAVISCKECGKESEIERFRLRCTKCGGNKVTLIAGRELYIDSLEVYDED